MKENKRNKMRNIDLTYAIEYLEAELDSLKNEYKKTDNVFYSEKILNIQNAIKKLKVTPETGERNEDIIYRKRQGIRKVLQNVALYGYDLISAEDDIIKLMNQEING